MKCSRCGTELTGVATGLDPCPNKLCLPLFTPENLEAVRKVQEAFCHLGVALDELLDRSQGEATND